MDGATSYITDSRYQGPAHSPTWNNLQPWSRGADVHWPTEIDPQRLTCIIEAVWMGFNVTNVLRSKKKKKRKAFDVVKCNDRLGMNLKNELSYKLELLNYKCAFEVEWSHQFLEHLALSSFYSSQRANVWGSCVGGQRDETEIQQPSITSYTTSQQWKALCTTH